MSGDESAQRDGPLPERSRSAVLADHTSAELDRIDSQDSALTCLDGG